MSEKEMDLEIDTKSKKVVSLNDLAVQKIDKWFEQINAKKKIKLSRKDLVNWLIEKHPENFSSSDMSQVLEKFYDEEKHLLQILKEVRRAKASGEKDIGVEVVVRLKKEKKEIVSVENTSET